MIMNKKLDIISDKILKESGKTLDELFAHVDKTEEQAENVAYSNYSYWKSTFITFRKNKIAMVFLSIIIILLLFTCIQPFLPNQKIPTTIYINPETNIQYRNIAPNAKFLMGTNSIGQDLWSRIWSGTRTSLSIGITVAMFNTIIGIIVGSLWGYVPVLDAPIRTLYNTLHNIPETIVLVLMAYILSPGVSTLVFSMCITGWLGISKFIRNQIMLIRDRENNLASRCLGTKVSAIIIKNLLPHLTSVIMMRTALAIPNAISNEVFLTYVGLGLSVDIPSLGNLITAGKSVMLSESLRYQLIFPSIVIALITISFYVIGTAFSDASDPHNHI